VQNRLCSVHISELFQSETLAHFVNDRRMTSIRRLCIDDLLDITHIQLELVAKK
ncbi:hypothetical protein MKX03_006733, partial [Papaver bracteatum]